MSSTLEDLRQTHEDVETLKHLSSFALQSRPSLPLTHPRLAPLAAELPTPRAAEQLARDLVRLASEKSLSLSSSYASGVAISRAHADLSTADPLSAFYARLRDLRDAHRSAGDAPLLRVAPGERERDEALLQLGHRSVIFSGEEGNGRYLDLMAHYTAFLNAVSRARKGPEVARVEYYEYVRVAATDFDAVPPAVRNAHTYTKYLSALLEYCGDFARRAHPLDRVEEHVEAARARVKEGIDARLKSVADDMPSAEAVLQALGADGVKNELLTLGLKCGGRPEDRAARLLKAARDGHYGERVVLEGVVRFVLDQLLAEEREATVANVRKKLSLSYAEIEVERIADEAVAEGALERARGAAEGEEEVESTLYNPKDVPLGWDGKPIPYWMYKLHGLNHEFKCEICGNATYKGPRAFERHFTDSQHVQGLRCLGIGYSKAFMMITRIEDANRLNEKLQRESEKAAFDEDADMEFEDAEGNVFNRKTYTDLVRQGLL